MNKAKRHTQNWDTLNLNMHNNSSLNDSLGTFASDGALSLKKQKSLNTMLLNSDKSTISKYNKNYEIEESLIIKEENLESKDVEISENSYSNKLLNSNSFYNNDISFAKSNSKTLNFFTAESQEKKAISNLHSNYLNAEKSKENKSSKDLLKSLTQEINIKNLRRPFTIFLHDLHLKKDFNSNNNEKTKECFYKLNIKIQIYCGSKEYTKPRTLEWKSTYFHKNRHIGKLIEFDLGYDTLPMFASIVFKIKVILFNKQKQPVRIEKLYWTNFKLFDHNRRLKTGNYF